MRAAFITGALAALASSAALAAAAPGPGAPVPLKEYAAGSEVQSLIAAAKAKRTNEPTITQPLISLAPYRANLEYRAGVGPASVHEDRAELFYVIQGSAILTTGGKLVNETRPSPTNLSGTAITGGTERRLQAGDIVIVPEKTPHWFTGMDPVIVVMSMHVPRGG